MAPSIKVKQRPLEGQDYLKAIGIVVMVLVHAELLARRAVGYQGQDQGDSTIFLIYLLLGYFSLSLPFYAGFYLRQSMQRYFVGQKIKSYPDSGLARLCITLGILESLKNGVLFGWEYYLKWDVLHFSALSIYIILLVYRRWGTKGLGFTLAFVVAVTWGSEQIIAAYYSLVLGANWVEQVSNILSKEQSLWIETMRLPLAILASPRFGTAHIWPLAPWFILPLTGFLLSHQLIAGAMKQRKIYFFGLLGLSVALGFFALPEYWASLDSKFYFSSKIFAASLLIPLHIALVSTTLILVIDLLVPAKPQWAFVRELSDGILPIYFIHFFVAVLAVKSFLMTVGLGWGLVIFPYFVLIMSFLLMQGFSLVYTSKFYFLLRKRP